MQPIRRRNNDRREIVTAVGLLALSLVLHFSAIGREGYSNTYYSAAARSMLSDLRSFFFVAADSAASVTVDKPPLGLWVEAAATAIFPNVPWASIIPQALAGAIATVVLYRIVRREAGFSAGVWSGILFALTPVLVAVARNNTIDATLILLLLLASDRLFVALRTDRPRPLWWAAILLGLAFNIKMLQAYMIVPALAATYLLFAPVALRQRLVRTAIAGVITVVVSFAWVFVVDLTPPERRPYVGSSETNSALELVVGHNGLTRLGIGTADGTRSPQAPTGRPPIPGERPDGVSLGDPDTTPPSSSDLATPPAPSAPIVGPFGSADGGVPFGGGVGSETGTPGVGRLFGKELAGQATWLLPFALIAGFAAVLRGGARLRRQRALAVYWLLWLVPAAVYFSATGGLFHRYYLAMLAPPIAALTASRAALLLHTMDRRRRSRIALVGLVVATTVVAQVILWRHGLTTIAATQLLFSLVGVGLILLTRFRVDGPRMRNRWFRASTVAVVFAGILAGPIAFTATPILYGGDVNLPYAGPELNTAGGGRPTIEPDSPIVRYLNDAAEVGAGAIAVESAMGDLVLAVDLPVMYWGGFRGDDPIHTTDEATEMVRTGELSFAVAGGPDLGGQGRPARPALSRGGQSQMGDFPTPATATGGTERGTFGNLIDGREPVLIDGGYALFDLRTAPVDDATSPVSGTGERSTQATNEPEGGSDATDR